MTVYRARPRPALQTVSFPRADYMQSRLASAQVMSGLPAVAVHKSFACAIENFANRQIVCGQVETEGKIIVMKVVAESNLPDDVIQPIYNLLAAALYEVAEEVHQNNPAGKY